MNAQFDLLPMGERPSEVVGEASSPAGDELLAAILHVFEQVGGWHWGITVSQEKGCGFRLTAFSESTFRAEAEERADGHQALVRASMAALTLQRPFECT
ncbi:hypothetical protein AAGS40_28535 (plasmid) [Paraburkholderia sp. PREW-6R]|uniref:hypothetical protein n=1 Tax=Paraburkholderia sp. PREW-6R TaxID=3141544 RepID=UPI0031F51DC8